MQTWYTSHYEWLDVTTTPWENLFSSSVFPMVLAAWHICLSTSSSLLIQRMILPSNTSVILQIWENGEPCSIREEITMEKLTIYMTYWTPCMNHIHKVWSEWLHVRFFINIEFGLSCHPGNFTSRVLIMRNTHFVHMYMYISLVFIMYTVLSQTCTCIIRKGPDSSSVSLGISSVYIIKTHNQCD